MELLQELVRNIVVIVIIGAIFEMMMPKSSMNRYLKLVVGLFIIGAMLNPMLKIARNPDLGNVIEPSNSAEQGPGIETILNNGKELNKKMNERGVKDYQKRLEQQITALAQLDKEVEILGTTVLIEDDSKSKSFGQIKEVNILAAKSKGENNEDSGSVVSPVEIDLTKDKKNQKKETQPLSNNAKDKIVKTVTSFYGLTPEKVHIQNP